MPELARVAVGLALVVGLPGILLLLALRVRLTVVELLALVPACSLAAVYVLAEFVTLVHIPFGPPAFFVLVGALAIAALVRVQHGWCRPVLDRDHDSDSDGRVHRLGLLVALGLLVVAIVIGGVTWLRPMYGRALIPPGQDATIHGFMVARVADSESINPADVLVTNRDGRQSGKYYPLSLHASLAAAHRITDAPIGYLFNATIVFFAAFVLPLSLFALTRFLIPKEPLVAGFAAILASLITLFPYEPISWGLIPLMVAMTLVPITSLVLIRTLGNAWSRAAAVLSGLVIAGDFALHNSEVPFILGLVALIVLFGGVRRIGWRDVLTRLLWIGLVAGVLLAPTWLQVLAARGERSQDLIRTSVGIGGFVGDLITLGIGVPQRQVGLVLLAGAGVVVLLWRREQVGWIVAAAIAAGLAILAATTYNAITNALTLPWYRSAERVSYNVTFFVAVFGGVVLGYTSRWVAEHLSRRSVAALPAVVVVVLALLYPVSGAQAIQANRDMVLWSYTYEAPIREGNIAAFRFMRTHSRQMDSVLTDYYIDAGSWMYPLAGVNPQFGVWAGAKSSDQVYLHDHIMELGTNERVDRIVRRRRVRFVYFGEQTMYQLGRHWLTLEMLRSSAHLKEVFNGGGAHVFEIRAA